MATTSETTYRPVFRIVVEHDGEIIDAGASYFSRSDNMDEAVEHARKILAQYGTSLGNGSMVVEQTIVTTTTMDVLHIGCP